MDASVGLRSGARVGAAPGTAPVRPARHRWRSPRVLTAVLLAGAVTSLAGCSSSTVPVPPGWQPVTYGGITIDVPGAWPVDRRSTVPCGIEGPGVLVGPPAPGAYHYRCPDISGHSDGPVLTFAGPGGIVPVGPERRETIHGVPVAVSKATYGAGTLDGVRQWTSEEVVRFPGRGAWLRAEVPATTAESHALAVVDEIVATVRPAS